MRISDWSSDVCSSVLCRRLASALKRRGIGVGDTVSVMLPNTPAMLEAHYGVPMSGAVLNAINIRLDAATIGFILDHAEARLVIVDREFTAVMAAAIAASTRKPPVVWVDDFLAESGEPLGEMEYEQFLETGDPAYDWERPDDEWRALTDRKSTRLNSSHKCDARMPSAA